jgi:hypothetical protein
LVCETATNLNWFRSHGDSIFVLIGYPFTLPVFRRCADAPPLGNFRDDPLVFVEQNQGGGRKCLRASSYNPTARSRLGIEPGTPLHVPTFVLFVTFVV